MEKEEKEENDQQNNYSDKSYWDNRFSSSDSSNFDWYADWNQLKSHFSFLSESDKILIVGCGNSKLSIQMYEDNFKDITNIDISSVVIKQMSEKYPNLKFQEMDATDMSFYSGTFDCVIDKGTLDAVMCSGQNMPSVNLIREMHRVTKLNKYFCIITYGSPETRLDYFKKVLEDDCEIKYEKINLSFMANFINSMRNSTKNHSIKEGITDPNLFMKSFYDAFVNTYNNKENMSEEEIKLRKKQELSLRLQMVLAKFKGDKNKMKKELGTNPIDFESIKTQNSEDKNSIRKHFCYLYIFKKLKN